jgi:hypothetical protein
MINLLLYYMLAGTAVAFLLETTVRNIGETVSWGERIVLIILWPIMLVWFLYNFFKGFFGK